MAPFNSPRLRTKTQSKKHASSVPTPTPNRVQTGASSNPHQISTRPMQVTPALALQWLEKNTNNRPVSDQRVKMYATDMLAGNWRVHHQGIGFDVNGVLVDGQHRLFAVIESGATVTMLVTHGLDPAAVAAIDAMRPRTVADQLHLLDKVENARTVVARASTIAILENNGVKGYKLSTDRAREIIEKHATGLNWASENLSTSTGKAWGKAPVAGVLAYAYPTNPEVVAKFAEQVKTGIGLKDTDPAYALREFLDGSKFDSETSRKVAMFATLRCVLAACRGEELRIVKGKYLANSNNFIADALSYFRK